MNNLRNTFFVIALLALLYVNSKACMCPGCVDLDDISFDKTVKRFPYALVKFDVAYPYGEKHEVYTAFSEAAHAVTDDLLIATVGIKDYGNYENRKLSERFHIKSDNYPAILLFRHGVEDYIQLPDYLDVTLDNLKSFVTSNTDLYIGCEGCLREFNDLAKNYANLNSDEQTKRLTQAGKLMEALSKEKDKKNANIYKIYMEKIQSNGYGFVEEETKRLNRLKAGKISDSKKSELSIKINILESFRISNVVKEDL